MGYGNIVAYRIVDRRVTGQAIETIVRVPYGDTRAISLGYYVTRCRIMPEHIWSIILIYAPMSIK